MGPSGVKSASGLGPGVWTNISKSHTATLISPRHSLGPWPAISNTHYYVVTFPKQHSTETHKDMVPDHLLQTPHALFCSLTLLDKKDATLPCKRKSHCKLLSRLPWQLLPYNIAYLRPSFILSDANDCFVLPKNFKQKTMRFSTVPPSNSSTVPPTSPQGPLSQS